MVPLGHRKLSCLPGEPDIGRLHWEGDLLIEEGTQANYTEEWQRIAHGPTAAMTLAEEAGWTRWLVICGNYFIYMHEQRTLLPTAESLNALLTGAATPDPPDLLQQVSPKQLLNCEISMGRCLSAEQAWIIQHSTLPWREGQSLWCPTSNESVDFVIDKGNAQIQQTMGDRTFLWTVQEWGELENLLPATRTL